MPLLSPRMSSEGCKEGVHLEGRRSFGARHITNIMKLFLLHDDDVERGSSSFKTCVGRELHVHVAALMHASMVNGVTNRKSAVLPLHTSPLPVSSVTLLPIFVGPTGSAVK